MQVSYSPKRKLFRHSLQYIYWLSGSLTLSKRSRFFLRTQLINESGFRSTKIMKCCVNNGILTTELLF